MAAYDEDKVDGPVEVVERLIQRDCGNNEESTTQVTSSEYSFDHISFVTDSEDIHNDTNCNSTPLVNLTNNSMHCSIETSYSTPLVDLTNNSIHCSIAMSMPPIAASTPTKQIKTVRDSCTMTSPLLSQSQLSHFLEASPSRPLSHIEHTLNTHFVRRMLNVSENGIIACKTKGQPLVLGRLTKHRKESASASARSLRRRTHTITRVRHHIAGSSEDSAIAQQAHELRRVKQAPKRKLLLKAGLCLKPKMNTLCALAMKESIDLSWDQLKRQRRFLTRAGLTIPSEAQLRRAQHSLAVTTIDTYMTENFIDKKGHPVTVKEAFGKVSDIKEFTFHLLDPYLA